MIKNNLIVAYLSLAIWAIFAFIEFWLKEFPYLRFFYFSTLPFILAGFIWANYRAFPSIQNKSLRVFCRCLMVVATFSCSVIVNLVVVLGLLLMLSHQPLQLPDAIN